MMTHEESMAIFSHYESSARSYCRNFPVIFQRASGSYIYDSNNEAYLDFLSCAGAVNYGHNPPLIKRALIDYLEKDGLQASLDMHSVAKMNFIQDFNETILIPRELNYKLQFTSPTGTSVVESAIKLARKVKNRNNIIAFTHAFHGMSNTALGLTGNRKHRQPNIDRHISRMPYENYIPGMDTVEYLEKLLCDNSSGLDIPAAIILETIQGEGGVNVCSASWLQQLRKLCERHDILLIIDDIQAGCGRSGQFFSFEFAGIVPDMVCLSKSLSGYGLPFSLLLYTPDLDRWHPGEDNGTFRGNTSAFVTASAALKLYWKNQELVKHIAQLETITQHCLFALCSRFSKQIKEVRGRGLFYGIEMYDHNMAKAITTQCFTQRLIIERSGERDQVIKIMPALTISAELLEQGLQILIHAIEHVLLSSRV
ncbi:diaminobutyrate--2-oxoglutarate transaminase [Xenorhabdus bovienii]|nr:diaminobutyrate--2-oxoglutarate transaminase [Xenorhabdus bovienii]